MSLKFAAIAVVPAWMLVASPAPAQAPSYSHEGNGISYFNTPNRNHVAIHPKDASTIATVVMTLDAPADVLVQFTSELAVESADGCPCSVRVLLQADSQEPVVVKRINVGSPAVQAVDKYEHDRQSIDGSFVFSLPAGKHSFSLIYLQVDGASKVLEVYYPNLQALSFTTKTLAVQGKQ